ncbi:MAG: ribosome small subunit-dependent GTPase A, partial [Phycisphaerae bacterium]|nr:ribosome small subunit-dependent GTPase A [Phycisphaerae bacterium]
STLINRLIPGVDLATRTVRPGDLRGRHTTSSASVYELPGGGMLVDTPGIRELGLPIDPVELPWYFPEFEKFTPDCKFNNCTHTHEPDCAVIEAVEQELIPINRFETYLQLLSTLED